MNRFTASGLVLLATATILFFLENTVRKWGGDKIVAPMRTVIGLIAIVLLVIGLMKK